MNIKTHFFQKYFVLALLFSFALVFGQKKFTIVLDAGHGGSDHGAVRRYADLGYVAEKDITLAVTLSVGRMLEKDKDFRVIYTRKIDEYPSLTDRTNLANRSKADLFISIHVNANAKTSPYGTETFVLGVTRNDENLEVVKNENQVAFLDEKDKENFAYYDPSSPESLIAMKIQQARYLESSLKLASFVEENFERKDNRFSRGVKQANFHVLRRTAMPSVLIEMGFLSNYDEASYLVSEKGQSEISKSIYNAIMSYKKAYDRKGNYTQTAPVAPPKPVEQPLKNDFRILLMSTPNRYDANSPELKGLNYVLTIKDGDVYKYYYATTNFASVRDNNLKTAKTAGFKNATAISFVPNQKLNQGYYTIEVAVSKNKLSSNSYILETLKDKIERNKENGTFYYTYGNVKSLEEAVSLQKELEKKGIKNTVIQKVIK
ncbi:MAG: N-acetylmuramoyl-L-alanine amidase [Bergeyella zoohelcum]|nr:N-acetylmuramoyl-L-alanine amidase [Bergeyella zoohelcum]